MDQEKSLKVEVFLVEPPKVATSSSSSSTQTSLPLTFFDLLWLRFPPSERLFIYEFPHATSSFFDSVLPNLKHSLQLTLEHFLPLAGNITWPLDSPSPIINYVPGDAVSFTVAESDPMLISMIFVPISVRQRNVFLSYPTWKLHMKKHLHWPCKSLSWAYACSKQLIESPLPSLSLSLPQHLTPYFDRSVTRDPRGILQVFVNEVLKQGGPNNRSLKVRESMNDRLEADAVRGLFELSPWHIEKLKQNAQSSTTKLKAKVVSTFSVTCAHMLACLVKLDEPKANNVGFIFAVDCRSRLDPPIPPPYFGNCIWGQIATVKSINLLGNEGFINALEGIMEALNIIVEDDVLSGAETWTSITEETFKEYKIYSVAGSPRFDVYGVDFGWGKPNKAEIITIDKTGAFAISDSSRNKGGIEIGLTLNKREMDAFSKIFAQALESLVSFETSQ
ncbi:hypothetical protein RIF29_19221 [Crotalaria pallida]|uniref:Uncharacterized protein n=1 Tax=Crotalaria pallida TaxID=3830 RepID=A0AAN9I5B5_CROPI